MREWGLSKEITRLVVPASAGTPPALPLHLRELGWWLNKTNLSFLPKFLSPHLTKIIITTDTFFCPGETVDQWDGLPDRVVPKMRSAIKAFPSSLQCLHIQLGDGLEIRLTEEISAFILGCGESLQELNTNLVLSTQAIVHLMMLSNLQTWVTEQGPPETADLIRHGLPDGVASLFPSLEALDLRSEAALEWLPLFEATNNGTPPWTMAGGSLPILAYRHSTLPVDSSLVSRILPLAGLTDVFLDMGCLLRPCTSKFTDQDVERLAIALPKLEALTLGGWPCGSDTCPTTVRSLLSLSIHCIKLRYLSIHFRTANLRADLLELLDYAYSHGLQSRPKCPLGTLVTGEMPLELAEHDFVLVSMGMFMIFPSLVKFSSRSPVWAKLELMVMAFGRVGGQITAVTESFIKVLKEAREQAQNGSPVRSVVSIRLSFDLTCGCGWVRIFIDITLCSFLKDEMTRIVCGPLSLT